MVSNDDSLRLASKPARVTTCGLHHTHSEQLFKVIGRCRAIFQHLKFKVSGPWAVSYRIHNDSSQRCYNHPTEPSGTTTFLFRHNGHAATLRTPSDKMIPFFVSLPPLRHQCGDIKHEAARQGHPVPTPRGDYMYSDTCSQ